MENNCTGHQWPRILEYVGKNYQESKGLSLSELAVLIDRDLMKLAKRYSELKCYFEVELKSFPTNTMGFK